MKKFITCLQAIAAIGLLSACLPEDKDPNAMVLAEEHGGGNSGFYGTSLSNLALQLQDKIVSDSNWFETIGAGQVLDLAALGIAPEGLPAPVKAMACQDASGGVTQVVWMHGSDSKGKFGIDAVGFSAAAMVSALSSRLSGSQVGIYEGSSKLAMLDNKTLTLPNNCGSLQSIPQGTPVIALQINRPATPVTQTSRTEFRTIECEAVGGVAQTGSKIQRRVVNYSPEGAVTVTAPGGGEMPFSAEAGWQDQTIGKCLDVVDVNVAIEDSTNTELGNLLNQFAAASLRGILENRLGSIDCVRASVSATNRDTANLSSACDLDGVSANANEAVSDVGQAAGQDVRVLSCAGVKNENMIPTFLGTASGTYPVRTDWGGTATLVRVRNNSQVSAISTANTQVVIGQWVGRTSPNGAACTGNEATAVNCNRIVDAPAEAARSGTRTISEVGGTLNVNFYGWGSCWSMMGNQGSDCGNVSPMQTRYLNPAYFNYGRIIQNGGVTVTNVVDAHRWSSPNGHITFKPDITGRHTYVMSRDQCRWETSRMIEDCPRPATVTEAGTWNTSINPANGFPASYDNTAPRLVFRDTDTAGNTGVLDIAINPSTWGNASTFNSVYRQMADRVRIWTGGFTNNTLTNLAPQNNHDGARAISNAMTETMNRYYTLAVTQGRMGVYITRNYNRYMDDLKRRNNYPAYIRIGHPNELNFRSWMTGSPVPFAALNYNQHAINLRTAACNAGQLPAAICNSSGYGINSTLNAQLRASCRMPKLTTTGKYGIYSPGLSGALKTFCEYVFDEWIYNTGDTRRYVYSFREMAAPNNLYFQTTLLNRDGVISTYRPVLVPQALQMRLTVTNEGSSNLQCARNEVQLFEVPISIRHRVAYECFGSVWMPASGRKASTGVSDKWNGFSNSCNVVFHHINTTTLFERRIAREYRSNSGWSRPRESYYWGMRGISYGSIPGSVSLDIPNQIVGGDCDGRDGACDAANITYSQRRL